LTYTVVLTTLTAPCEQAIIPTAQCCHSSGRTIDFLQQAEYQYTCQCEEAVWLLTAPDPHRIAPGWK